jgi:Alpha/beta hydrolase domain
MKISKLSWMALGIAAAFNCNSEVIKFDVLERSIAFEGRVFPNVGTYTLIKAKAIVALDPKDKRNSVIADINFAPQTAKGLVEAAADVVLLQPTNTQLGNQTLLVDVPNRGRKLAPQLFDDSPQPGANNAIKAQDAGIAYLHRQGYTMAWIGWQGDIPTEAMQLAMQAPSAIGLTGNAREEFQFDHLTNPINVRLSALIENPSSVKASVRAHWSHPRATPADLSIKVTGPQSIEISRPKGFDAGALYEVTYQAKDPVLFGMGFAVTRDITAMLKSQTNPLNPLIQNGSSHIQRAIGFGVSQSGRFLRDFLWLGFNEDLNGKQVFEGLMPHVAGARRMATNYRFGQPSRNSRHPQDPAWQIDLFPFTYEVMTDPFTGQKDGLLLKCRQTQTCPKVMQTDSEHEWWASRASLLVTDPSGNHIDLPANVRAYMIAGTPHFAEPGTVMTQAKTMSLPVNPMHAGQPMRALLSALNQWISVGTEPPASRVPMKAHGTLVPADLAVPKNIPALPYQALYTSAYVSDHNLLPPKVLGRYEVLVPLADADGVALAGIRSMPLAVPKASYTAWNPRAVGYGPGNLFPLQGAMSPFAKTKAERESAQDPRLSLEERYTNQDAYVEAVKVAAQRFVKERLLLPEDAERNIERAKADLLSQIK